MKKHLGLAPAKVAGAREATGKILAFLDSHCEVNVGWYEPLAAAIEENRGTVANPIIDGISSETFDYGGTRSFTRGVFTWGMYFAGEPYGAEDQETLRKGGNVATPAMPGGLFAIDRSFFEELGYYDEGLRVWGGENIELSLKAWRCGGRVIFVPCSRVGHVYKAVSHHFPAGESLQKNYRRIAEVWFDDFKEIYYKSFPAATAFPAGDLREAHAVRQRLTCEPMSWFIENVFPTMFVPRPVLADGMIRSGSGAKALCINTDGVEIASNPMQQPHVSPAALRPCAELSNHNQWYLMPETQRLVHIGIWTEECLGVRGSGKKASVVVCQCARYPGSGCSADEIRWKRVDGEPELVHASTGWCLTRARKGRMILAACNESMQKIQSWAFDERNAPTGHDIEL
mmetsp:Transcript_122100/g.345293  ORF Transcript_122100/g.345293 Transcript_122100/m.345293 type:complete len:400 (+) Transcript_122100:1-1200(+)